MFNRALFHAADFDSRCTLRWGQWRRFRLFLKRLRGWDVRHPEPRWIGAPAELNSYSDSFLG